MIFLLSGSLLLRWAGFRFAGSARCVSPVGLRSPEALCFLLNYPYIRLFVVGDGSRLFSFFGFSRYFF